MTKRTQAVAAALGVLAVVLLVKRARAASPDVPLATLNPFAGILPPSWTPEKVPVVTVEQPTQVGPTGNTGGGAIVPTGDPGSALALCKGSPWGSFGVRCFGLTWGLNLLTGLPYDYRKSPSVNVAPDVMRVMVN